MAVRVSPGWTRYEPPPTEAVALLTGDATELVATSSLSPSPSPASADPDATEVVAPCAGIWIPLPAISCAVGETPWAAASCATLRPSAAATEESDSPGLTTWTKSADADAGTMTATAETKDN